MNVKLHSVAWQYTMTTLPRSDFIPNCNHISKFDISPNLYERFPYDIYDGCVMPTGDALSSEHLVLFHLGLAYVLLVETNPYPKLVVFLPDYVLRTSLGTFQILLLKMLLFFEWFV